MKKTIFLFGLAIFAQSFTDLRATIRNVPSIYPTLQEAFIACLPGDTVLVQPGTYFTNANWPSVANIKLLSAGDSSNTFLDGNHAGRVLTIGSSQVDTNTIIRGFAIINGFLNSSTCRGAGVYIVNCSPKFEFVSIRNNHTQTTNWNYGAGLHGSNTNAIFRYCTIRGNVMDSAGWGYGGGVHLTNGGSPEFSNCAIIDNIINSQSWNYGAGVYVNNANPVFNQVVISRNFANAGASWYYGIGMFIGDGNTMLNNVLISGNESETGGSFYYGGGIVVYGAAAQLNFANLTVTANKKTDNGTINGSGLYVSSGVVTGTNGIFWNPNSGNEITNSGGTITIGNSDVRGGFPGTGNFNSDPLFFGTGDYHLTTLSPCVNAGSLSGAPAIDLDNLARPLPAATNPDVGAYENNQALGPVSIFTTGFAGAGFCLGASINVSFTTSGTFSSGNVFRVQLSDISGSFVYPVEIGLITSSTPTPILCTIPIATTPGSGYRIRVVSSNPYFPGNDNGSDLTLEGPPSLNLTAQANPACIGASVNLIANGGVSWNWMPGSQTNDTITVVPTGNQTYTVTAQSASGCETTDTLSLLTLNAPVVSLGNIDPDTICVYALPFALPAGSPAGGTYQGQGVTGSSFDPFLAALGSHEVSYIYTNGSGCSDNAFSVVLVEECTGIAKETSSDKFMVRYISTHGLLEISGFQPGTYFEIYDITGRLAINGLVIEEKQTFALGLPSGMYIFKTEDCSTKIISTR